MSKYHQLVLDLHLAILCVVHMNAALVVLVGRCPRSIGSFLLSKLHQLGQYALRACPPFCNLRLAGEAFLNSGISSHPLAPVIQLSEDLSTVRVGPVVAWWLETGVVWKLDPTDLICQACDIMLNINSSKLLTKIWGPQGRAWHTNDYLPGHLVESAMKNEKWKNWTKPC